MAGAYVDAKTCPLCAAATWVSTYPFVRSTGYAYRYCSAPPCRYGVETDVKVQVFVDLLVPVRLSTEATLIDRFG